MNLPEEVRRAVLTPEEVSARYGIGRDTARELLRSGTLPVIAIGTKYLVPIRALEAYEDELGREAARKAVNNDAT